MPDWQYQVSGASVVVVVVGAAVVVVVVVVVVAQNAWHVSIRK
jgi:hypothetical protein